MKKIMCRDFLSARLLILTQFNFVCHDNQRFCLKCNNIKTYQFHITHNIKNMTL